MEKRPPDLSDDFDAAMAALLAVKPPPSGKKAVARKTKRAAVKIAKAHTTSAGAKKSG